VADTLGELGLFYRLDAPVFMGGSLVPHGGQNPLEPARLGRAVAFGPHTHNFAEATAALLEAGGAARVADADALAEWVDAMLRDPDRRAAMGQAGEAAAGRYADLPDRIAEGLLELLPPAMITPG
jgi:3-deoxy-D-manno-octulosonic-acid transferase